MFKKEPESHNGIYYIGSYYPISKGDSSDHSSRNFTTKILALKKGYEIDYFAYLLESEYLDLNSQICIAVIPSHDPNKLESGVTLVARKLARNRNIFNAIGCLRRTVNKGKLSSGKDRSLKINLDSLEVANSSLIENKNILLLDDVTTTGNSLRAGELLLKESGASSIVLLALARTVSC
jgi:predicted amidophosphoribosyltransferase